VSVLSRIFAGVTIYPESTLVFLLFPGICILEACHELR